VKRFGGTLLKNQRVWMAHADSGGHKLQRSSNKHGHSFPQRQQKKRAHHEAGTTRKRAQTIGGREIGRVWFGFFLASLSEKLAVGKSWLLGKAGG